MSGPYQGRDLSNCGVGRLRVAINCGVLSVKRSPETAIFTSGKSSKCNGRHHAFGSVSSSETRSTTSEVEFLS